MTVPALDPKAPPAWKPPSPLPERFETPRLVLRYWTGADAPGMLAAMAASRATLVPWMAWGMKDNRTLEECIYNIERFRRTREGAGALDYALGIFDRATGEPLGGTGFHRLNVESQHAEIGYWVREDRRRQGLCTEAVRHLLSWAFTPQSEGGWGFRRIDIFCAGNNAASRGVPEKIGLRHEYQAKEARWIDGMGWEDTLGWGVLEREWDRERNALR